MSERERETETVEKLRETETDPYYIFLAQLHVVWWWVITDNPCLRNGYIVEIDVCDFTIQCCSLCRNYMGYVATYVVVPQYSLTSWMNVCITTWWCRSLACSVAWCNNVMERVCMQRWGYDGGWLFFIQQWSQWHVAQYDGHLSGTNLWKVKTSTMLHRHAILYRHLLLFTTY